MENNDKVNKILVNNYELLIKSTEPVIVRFLSYGECTDLLIDIKDIRNKVIDYGGMF